jgi:hypothetical protein
MGTQGDLLPLKLAFFVFRAVLKPYSCDNTPDAVAARRALDPGEAFYSKLFQDLNDLCFVLYESVQLKEALVDDPIILADIQALCRELERYVTPFTDFQNSTGYNTRQG